MPRKGGRHAREPSLARSPHRNNRRDTTDNSQQQQQQQQQLHNNQQQQQQQQRPAVKHFRPVHIGPVNGKRWLALKKRLGLANDEDVAVYLLDLAESVTRNDDKCNGTEDETRRERDEGENDETILPVKETVHRPEEPLRRSTRVQNSQEGAAADGSTLVEDARPTEDREKSRVKSRGSRSRHHRNKGKHHKDKRKRKRHSKDPETTLDGEKGKHLHQEPGTEERTDTKPETASDRFEVSEGSVSTKTEHVDRVELVENVNNTERRGEEEEEEEGGTNPRIVQDVQDDLPADERRIDQDQDRFQAPSLEGDVLDKEAPGTVQEEGIQDAQEPGSALKEGSEERRSRKRRRRPRYEFDDEEDTEPRDVSSEDIPEAETTHKHRRKRHRHGGEHKNRKHHDVRKAPQDGIVVVQDPVQDTQGALDGANQTERTEPEVNSAENNHRDERSPVAEPQRLAIKIKLCQECNSRHLQDACPLTSPRYSIQDTVRFEDWLERHKDNTEVAKAIKSDDPMSEGYGGKIADEPFESDEEATQPSEHAKVKGNKAQREEKLLTVDVDRPLYARDSLPDCFELRIANSEHGLGIYAKSSVPMYVKLGPLVGRPVREMDIPDDFSMRHIWEIDNNGRTTYVSTTNPLRSNWIRYIRPADTKEERSVAVITKQGELHLVTTQNIVSGMELTYWADSQSSAWTRKNKVDKTNCGGCNLNFAHPIYYRLHCCIFHDTNYSLTIRKYHCKVCGAAVLGKDNIMKHAAELHAGRGAYQCQYCKKFFLRLNYLEMHRTYGCAQNPQRSRPLCDFCGRKFCQPQKLKVHIKRMHSDMSEVLREFQCKLCLKLLGSRAALQRHMKEVHHKDVVGAATCDRCGKMFQNKSNLKIHMLTHSGVKPFKCKENGCKAAFTTKQCLQFHYKKVHGLTEEMMPKIERSVAYTFDAYSGGLVEDAGRGKTPRPSRRNSQHQENSNSLPSLDDCSSESNMKMEPASNPVHAAIIEFQNGPSPKLTKYKVEHDSRISTPVLPPAATVCNALEPGIEPLRPETDLYTSSRLQSKGSKKWLGEFNPPNPGGDVSTGHMTGGPVTGGNVYEFEESRKESPDEKVTAGNNQVPRPPPPPPPPIIEDNKLGLSVYRRTESSNASLLVEAALDAAERDIGAVSSPILEDNDRDGNLYSISGQLQSPMPQRSPGHLETYMQQQQQQQQDELISPAPTPDNRHTPPGHLDYHLHRPCPVDYLATARATHNMDQYLHHEDMQRVASPNSYMHLQQDDLVSPSATPNPRYQEVHHHHQVPTDNLSSDEGDSVAQNLSLSVKEKPPQLDLSTSYKYDTLDQEFRDRANFEPLVLNAGELQGLDMSARGFHHAGFPGQVQNTRYHHHHHLYEIAERQSVDLSRTGGYSMSPPPPLPPPQPPPTTAPPPPPYPHTDVLRVVSLDLTPGGRHSVDLTLSRSHHLHGSGGRVIASPQPPPGSGTTPHVVPDNVVDSRILSPPPPPLSGYNPSYPVSPAPYHPPRPGYHPYSGYY